MVKSKSEARIVESVHMQHVNNVQPMREPVSAHIWVGPTAVGVVLDVVGLFCMFWAV